MKHLLHVMAYEKRVNRRLMDKYVEICRNPTAQDQADFDRVMDRWAFLEKRIHEELNGV